MVPARRTFSRRGHKKLKRRLRVGRPGPQYPVSLTELVARHEFIKKKNKELAETPPEKPEKEGGLLFGALPVSEPEAYREEIRRRRPIQLAQNTHQTAAANQSWAAGQPAPANEPKLTAWWDGKRIPDEEEKGQPSNPGIWGRLPKGVSLTESRGPYNPRYPAKYVHPSTFMLPPPTGKELADHSKRDFEQGMERAKFFQNKVGDYGVGSNGTYSTNYPVIYQVVSDAPSNKLRFINGMFTEKQGFWGNYSSGAYKHGRIRFTVFGDPQSGKPSSWIAEEWREKRRPDLTVERHPENDMPVYDFCLIDTKREALSKEKFNECFQKHLDYRKSKFGDK